jgi:hypothetical protein
LTDEEDKDKDSIHELPVQLLFEEDQYERATLSSKKKLKIHQRQGGNSVLQPNRTKMGATTRPTPKLSTHTILEY